jgi:hypothetical protein
MAMTGDQPVRVIPGGEIDRRQAQLLDGFEVVVRAVVAPELKPGATSFPMARKCRRTPCRTAGSRACKRLSSLCGSFNRSRMSQQTLMHPNRTSLRLCSASTPGLRLPERKE